MRPGPGKFAAVAVLFTFTVSGCGSSGEKPPDLIKEYQESTDVDNDTFREGMDSARVQDMLSAAKDSKDSDSDDVMRAIILSAYSCDDYYNGPPSPDCSPGRAEQAIDAAAGSDGNTYARSILVKRDSGSLEFVTLFVVRDGSGDAVLIDATGQTYRGGLADFRANNSLLSPDDWMLAPADITAVSADDEIPLKIETVTVPGHTPGTWGWWLGAAGLAVALFVGYLWFTWSPRDKRRAPDNSDAGMLGSL